MTNQVAEAIAELETEVEFSNLRLAYLETHDGLNNMSKVFWVEYHRYLTTHLAEFRDLEKELNSGAGLIYPESKRILELATTKAQRLLGEASNDQR